MGAVTGRSEVSRDAFDSIYHYGEHRFGHSYEYYDCFGIPLSHRTQRNGSKFRENDEPDQRRQGKNTGEVFRQY